MEILIFPLIMCWAIGQFSLNGLPTTRGSLGSDVVFGFLFTFSALASYVQFMPRRLRIEYEDAIYHVMTRGNARQDIGPKRGHSYFSAQTGKFGRASAILFLAYTSQTASRNRNVPFSLPLIQYYGLEKNGGRLLNDLPGFQVSKAQTKKGFALLKKVNYQYFFDKFIPLKPKIMRFL